MESIILVTLLLCTISPLSEARKSYEHKGCYKDKVWPFRAISKFVETFPSSSAIQQCADYAAARGYEVFGVQDEGECFTGPKAHETYAKYGQADDDNGCKNGLGGWYRNDIYEVTPPLCGKRSGVRIVGGEGAERNSWPWQARLMYKNRDEQLCGGALLNNEWVVTAAHCVYGEKSKNIKVRLGAINRKDDNSDSVQILKLDKFISHPEFSAEDAINDIALIKLKKRAVYTDAVKRICLPDGAVPFERYKKNCWITGWGSEVNFGERSDVLQQARIPLVSSRKCERITQEEVHESEMCAGADEGGVDACTGDSGGPLVCEYNGQWHLEGLTSHGDGWAQCGAKGTYGFYANIRHFHSWIEEILRTE